MTRLVFPLKPGPRENVREAGEDTGQGGLLCPKGKNLNPADIGLLAAAGIATVKVYRQLNITFFSTGDELVAIGQPLMAGKIYDSKQLCLVGVAERSLGQSD